jgi:phosphatidylinositol alpha 1,6-mannosyltransferase
MPDIASPGRGEVDCASPCPTFGPSFPLSPAPSRLRVMSRPETHNDGSRAPRRIALFTGNYNHIADGVALTLNRLVAYLEQNGLAEVQVFAPTVKKPPIEHAGTLVPVSSISAILRPEYRIALGISRAARRQLEEFQPNLVHIATPDFLGRAALRWAQKHDVPVVASYHTHFSSYLKYYGFEELEGFLWKYLRRFYRQCRHVYVPSQSMAAVLRAHEIREGLRLWERGVDTHRFNPNKRSLAWRRQRGIGDDEVVVTFIGRLVLEKGLHIYADVIEGLRARGLPHRSLIVGEGPAREEVEQRLPDTIFAGHLSGEDLPRAYASSDVFLFPSDTETFGNVTLEAMASGLPTVCADATGSSELVQHEVTGYLAPPGHSPVFLDYTARLVSDAERRVRMGARAVARADHYDWEAVLARIVSYYDEILCERPAPDARAVASRIPASA